MKKGYKRLLIFEIIIFAFLLLNIFTKNYLNGLKLSLILGVILVIFKIFFGFEKDRHRYIKDFILDETIFIILFLIAFYLFGVLIGFSKANYWNINGFRRFIIPTATYIILREYFRYMLLTKSDGNNLLSILSVILIFFMDIAGTIYFSSLTNGHSIFLLLSVTILPAVFNNISFSYITKRMGYKPIIYYCLIIELYVYLIPIVPNPGQYINAIIDIVLPTILGYRAYRFFEHVKDRQIERNYYKNRNSLKSLTIPVVIVCIMVYFISGYFRFWAVVVASGSMTGSINKGDIVIIDKQVKDYDKLEIGQVIAYKHNNKIIIHRIVDKVKMSGEQFYITKGDANSDIDNLFISKDMIVGIVDARVPYLGMPTVWLNG